MIFPFYVVGSDLRTLQVRRALRLQVKGKSGDECIRLPQNFEIFIFKSKIYKMEMRNLRKVMSRS